MVPGYRIRLSSRKYSFIELERMARRFQSDHTMSSRGASWKNMNVAIDAGGEENAATLS
jgi:hypothetical protein